MLSSTRTQALAAVYCHWSQVGGFPGLGGLLWRKDPV